ncbi:hypothetical protein J5X92_20740 [Alteromonas sp. K632G]|jgi:hypothetical protein|uniref:hypothetical protein n=1 Tax=Alteromonas sp. K632G TaxID=2820757 RepID=UPI001AD65F12|nr:hypothetical protein [Alteromonas sp. K632G]MBO7924627.1 hypothetical protein [Alteromonas sp. K632G]
MEDTEKNVVSTINYANDQKLYGSKFAGQVCFKKTYSSLAAAKRQLKLQIHKSFGCDVSFSKKVLCYTNSFGGYKYQENDIALSPFKVKNSGLVDIAGNSVIYFTSQEQSSIKESLLSKLNLIESNAELDDSVRKPLSKALTNGFHDCDLRYGFDYCLQRLAWLAGQYAISFDQSKDGFSVCHVLARDMACEAEL